MPHLLGAAWLAAAVLAAEAPSPILVELFTSQGCSSCPDADALLSGWGAEEFRKGRIVPLSFDVDYWDYLGWKDVFSSPAYSTRQRRYAAALGVRVYTPQLVVSGRSAFVGSEGRRLKAEVRRLSGAARGVRLEISREDAPAVRLRVKGRVLEGARGRRLVLALFENGLRTDVKSGENAGRILRNDFVARRLVDLGPLPAESGKDFTMVVDEPWDSAWVKARAGAVVFVQDEETLAVSDAALLYPLES